MRKLFSIFTACLCLAVIASAQQKPRAKRPMAKPAAKAAEPVKIASRTFTSEAHHFSITFPNTWFIAGEGFAEQVQKQGIDLSLKAPASVDPITKARLDRSLERITILVTAYRAAPEAKDNAIMRVSAEDLSLTPQIKDAVDYFDVMRAMFRSMKLPPDFKYSETQAEKLGQKQFAFLDVSSSAGKKRMYATVRNGFAIMFTLTYSRDEDLQTMRQTLANGNFALE